MKFYLILMCLLMNMRATGAELEFSDYNKLIVSLELYEGMPIAYVFSRNNEAIHFHTVEREGDYFLITNDTVNSWLEKGSAFKKSLSLEDVAKVTDNPETIKTIKALMNEDSDYKILHFYPWFGALHQNKKLKDLKEKRETLFASINAKDNKVRVIEIDLSDRKQIMQTVK